MGSNVRDVRDLRNVRNARMHESQREMRKKRQMQNRLFLLTGIGILLVFLLYIREINAQLKQIQDTLKRIETMPAQYGAAQTANKLWEETDYVSSIGVAEVGQPMQRSWDETLLRLRELGQTDSVIDEISRNSALYPESMLTALANNPEMAGYVAGYLNGSGAGAGGLTDSEKRQAFPLLLQWDPRWGYQSYGSSFIGVAGCGPTCLAMVLYYLTGDETLTPDRIAAYAMENGYYVAGTGTAWALLKDFPPLYGVQVTEVKVSARAVRAQLDRGAVLICAMGKGEFTAAGHFIVLYGYDEEGFMVNDPNCVARSRKRWAFEEMEGQIKSIWSFTR